MLYKEFQLIVIFTIENPALFCNLYNLQKNEDSLQNACDDFLCVLCYV